MHCLVHDSYLLCGCADLFVRDLLVLRRFTQCCVRGVAMVFRVLSRIGSNRHWFWDLQASWCESIVQAVDDCLRGLCSLCHAQVDMRVLDSYDARLL